MEGTVKLTATIDETGMIEAIKDYLETKTGKNIAKITYIRYSDPNKAEYDTQVGFELG